MNAEGIIKAVTIGMFVVMFLITLINSRRFFKSFFKALLLGGLSFVIIMTCYAILFMTTLENSNNDQEFTLGESIEISNVSFGIKNTILDIPTSSSADKIYFINMKTNRVDQINSDNTIIKIDPEAEKSTLIEVHYYLTKKEQKFFNFYDSIRSEYQITLAEGNK